VRRARHTFATLLIRRLQVFEAQVSNERGDVSLSGQFAPFNAGYWLNNASGTEWQGYDPTFRINSYRG
jgi:hypothetical protein